MVDDATLAPNYAIEINGEDIGENISRFVRHVEYESADGIADMAMIRLVNPDALISEAKVFQPGNEMSIFMGYGSFATLNHVGRVVLVRQVPNFPQEAEPTLTVTGYTKDSAMMDNQPEKSKNRTYDDEKWSDVVGKKAKEYKMETDIDPTPDAPKKIIQKSGVSDYDFVKGMANITGFVFWVDGKAGPNSDSNWTLHFKDPKKLQEQDKTYTFKYDFGDEGSLLSFVPELLVKGAKTKLAVSVKDRLTGRTLRAEVVEENEGAPDLDATGDLTGGVQEEYTTASDIKIYFNNFSFDVVTNRRFQIEAEVTDWAQQWFRRMRENFIMSRGKTIGIETLMARQTHGIEGVGKSYSGQYYFSKVKQIQNESEGYVCDFACRKVVPA
jgi:phage protein D